LFNEGRDRRPSDDHGLDQSNGAAHAVLLLYFNRKLMSTDENRRYRKFAPPVRQ
jgi:hypothetical protein